MSTEFKTIADLQAIISIEEEIKFTPLNGNILIRSELLFDTVKARTSSIITLNDKGLEDKDKTGKGFIKGKFFIEALPEENYLGLKVGDEVILNHQLFEQMSIVYDKHLAKTYKKHLDIINAIRATLDKTLKEKCPTFTAIYYDIVPTMVLVGKEG